MSRTRRSARQAGSRFERAIADYLNAAYTAITGLESFIDRRPKTGAKDRGDIGGVRRLAYDRAPIARIVIECKDTSSIRLAEWTREAEIERGNDDALAGVVVHKRRGVGAPGQQWVTMTVDQLIALMTGERVPSVLADGLEAIGGNSDRDTIAQAVSEAHSAGMGARFELIHDERAG